MKEKKRRKEERRKEEEGKREREKHTMVKGKIIIAALLKWHWYS